MSPRTFLTTSQRKFSAVLIAFGLMTWGLMADKVDGASFTNTLQMLVLFYCGANVGEKAVEKIAGRSGD